MAVDTIVTNWIQRGDGALSSTLRGLGNDFDSFEGKQARMALASNAMISGGAGVIGVLGLIGGAALKSGSQLEGVEAGLTSMLGSSDAAKNKIKELQNFAATSAFDFGQSAKSAQQLLSMGFAADELIPTMKAVANSVSAAGGDSNSFSGVLLALGQIKTKGKLSAEELLQMAERGIPVFQILQKELGLTKEQVADIGSSGLDADEGIRALLKGMGAVGGGTALETMSETLPGKLSNLGDSINQTSAAVSTLFSSDAKDFIGTVSSAVDKMREFIETNPELAKGLLKGVAVGGAVMVGAGALGKLAGVVNEVADAKQKLLGATKADDLAEKAKTLTAGREAGAIGGVGDAADDAKGKLEELAQSKFDEFMENPKKAMQEWKGQAMSAVGSVRTLMAQPLTLGGRSFSQVSAFGQGGGAVSNAAAAGGVAIGAAAGYGAYDDWAALGASKAEAMAAGAFTGAGTAAAALFIPGAAIPLSITTGFRYAFNELINRPMEREAERGSGLSDETIAAQKGKSPTERAADFDALAAQKRQQREDLDSTFGWQPEIARQKAALEDDIKAAELYAQSLRNIAKMPFTPDATGNTPAYLKETQTMFDQANAEQTRRARRNGVDQLAKIDSENPNAGVVDYGRRNGYDWALNGSVQQSRGRDDSVTVRLPEIRIAAGPGDRAARRLENNTLTAAPNY
jgi:tape measure domain-containing protein